MKTWRTIAAAIAAFSLAAAIGCNADTGTKEDHAQPEPAVRDEGGPDAGDGETPGNGPQTEDEGGAGADQGADPQADTGGNAGAAPGDQPADQPMPTDPLPQADDPAAGEGRSGDDGTASILPITEPEPKLEILPAVPEPTDGGPIAPGGNTPAQDGGVDPNTPVSKNAATP